MVSSRPASRTALVAALVCLGLAAPASTEQGAPSERERAERALNRLTFGARDGDLERVLEMGLGAWIDLQLHPERIPDAKVGKRLARYAFLEISASDLIGRARDEQRERRARARAKRAEGDAAPEQEQAREAPPRQNESMSRSVRRQVVGQMQAAKLTRAIYSERQLEELLVDFWFNHFNVFAGKKQLRYVVPEYERKVIRPHVLGRFEDLLMATAKSPAMLFYLDNWLSVDPAAAKTVGARRGRPGNMRRGLNENYARELLELHTLGVDGGYTQQDVTELARILTGWTLRGARRGELRFFFDARMHDGNDKLLLGERIRGGGIEEGEAVIRSLARRPETARFITAKLVTRFVADDPPSHLVERAAATFAATQGDIREVLKVIFAGPEFYSPEYRTAKFKTPLEFVVSAVRASGAEVRDARRLARAVAGMGMPLYLSTPPTGFEDGAEAWVSTNALVSRLAFATAITSGSLRGVRIDPARWSAASSAGEDLASELAGTLLPTTRIPEPTLATIREEGDGDPRLVASLLLGSPEFQRR